MNNTDTTIRRYDPETEQAIREARDGIGLSRAFDSIDELLDELDADEQTE